MRGTIFTFLSRFRFSNLDETSNLCLSHDYCVDIQKLLLLFGQNKSSCEILGRYKIFVAVLSISHSLREWKHLIFISITSFAVGLIPGS